MSEEKLKPELPKELNLQKDFESPSYKQWREVIEKDLKGVPFEKKLITKTYEGIDLQPIYTKKDLENLEFIDELPGEGNFLRGKNFSGYKSSGWEICQDLPYPLAEEYSEALRNDLSRGQNSISLKLDEASINGLDADQANVNQFGKNGVSISSVEDIEKAFNNIDITKFPIHIDTGYTSLQFLPVINGYLKKKNVDADKIKGSISADPISSLISNGKLPLSIDNLFDQLKTSTDWSIQNIPNIKTIGVSGLSYHNSGANAVQELAYTLAAGVEYINALLERGLDINHITNRMRFTFGIGTFFFMEVAKLRAAKILWSKITEAYGADIDYRKMVIHARTGLFTQTKFDPYVNLLRTTTEAFSAVVGGIDSIHTNTFDEVIGLPDQFSRRIARNVQIILNEESHLTDVIDPAGGSFFVEKLTDEIAKAAWKEFQKIESMGGLIKALQEGYIQKEIDNVWETRKKDISKRKSVIVGTNMYANIKEEIKKNNYPDHKVIQERQTDQLRKLKAARDNEKVKTNLDALSMVNKKLSAEFVDKLTEAILNGATLGEISKVNHSKTGEGISINKIELRRASEFFESLREKAEEIKLIRGSRPKVFFATMGSIKQYKSRADFSQGFFEIGGFEIEYPRGFESSDDAVKAADESNADVVVICSTDETYPELVPPFTKGIKKANKNVTVVLAGYPKDQIEEHKKSGVDEFIYLGCDVFELLNKILSKIK
ncbi:methylmalonyl-coa mutase [hydrocarbon metagenome]|uniref:Methylmalonyl-coa mutase n=1 Tax=hydrocarbon metagenome TaxID=938273 RepID=A0A0W8FW07_9ZZZZ